LKITILIAIIMCTV